MFPVPNIAIAKTTSMTSMRTTKDINLSKDFPVSTPLFATIPSEKSLFLYEFSFLRESLLFSPPLTRSCHVHVHHRDLLLQVLPP